jgi:hypothetical protein
MSLFSLLYISFPKKKENYKKEVALHLGSGYEGVSEIPVSGFPLESR